MLAAAGRWEVGVEGAVPKGMPNAGRNPGRGTLAP